MSDIACNLCGTRDARVMFRKDSVDFLQCRECGLEWVHPLPDMEKMRELYSSPKYYNTDNISQFGYSEYVRNKHLYVNLFNRRLDELLLYTDGKRGLLLDVGCATGTLLELARLRGWDVMGVDVSEYATGIAHDYYNLDVFTGELAEAGYVDGQFDVVVMDDLIEHVADPAALVREGRRILKPGGLLTLNTPNRAGLWHLLMGQRWFHYRQMEHTFFFSPAVMTDLLDRHGFDVLEIHSSSKIIDLNYAFGRLRYYNMGLSNLLTQTVGRLLISSVTFPIRVGEMVVFARKR
ncbi:MAG: class I SAM-dependent methyltransferase [Anaerolineae bacterium]|jgi:SAM-dependent methyltransferase